MSESPKAHSKRQSLPLITLLAAALVLLLAVSAAFLPNSGRNEMRGIFLVYDTPEVGADRVDFFKSLTSVLDEISDHPMELVIASSRSEFLRLAQGGVDFILCPDGLALKLEAGKYFQMVSGRRKLPSNLRPRGVMVFRKAVGFAQRPWESHPGQTVFGDSLSLVSVGGVGPVSGLPGCTFGPDPYDHTPVLHALRLGAFDFALVRQWDADDFFSSGLLDSEVWEVKNRTIPVPDVVVMVSSEIPLVDRLKWADSLAMAGRSEQSPSESIDLMVGSLGKMGLVGFNILLEPDFELVRRNFARHWPGAAD